MKLLKLNLIAIAVCLLSFPQNAFAYRVGEVIRPNVSSSLNMRSRASSRSRRVRALRNNDYLTVIGRRGNWVKVRNRSGRVGYVYSRYTRKVPASRIQPQATSGTYKLTNVKNWASLLPSAQSSYNNRLAKVDKGDTVQAIAKDPVSGRVKVRYQDESGKSLEGWVDQIRLKKVSDSSPIRQAKKSPAPKTAIPPNQKPRLDVAAAPVAENKKKETKKYKTPTIADKTPDQKKAVDKAKTIKTADKTPTLPESKGKTVKGSNKGKNVEVKEVFGPEPPPQTGNKVADDKSKGNIELAKEEKKAKEIRNKNGKDYVELKPDSKKAKEILDEDGQRNVELTPETSKANEIKNAEATPSLPENKKAEEIKVSENAGQGRLTNEQNEIAANEATGESVKNKKKAKELETANKAKEIAAREAKNQGLGLPKPPSKNPRKVAAPKYTPLNNKEFVLGNVKKDASLLPSPTSKYNQRVARVPLGQKVSGVARDPKTGRIKVKYNDANGRPKEGWIDGDRLNSPQQVAQQARESTQSTTCSNQELLDFFEAESTSADLNCGTKPPRTNYKGSVLSRIIRNSPRSPVRRSGRTIYEWPMGGLNKDIGFCGSKHIRGHRQRPHSTALTGCLMAGVAQDWRKQFCPNNSRHCQLAFGDLTFREGKKRRIKRGKKSVSRYFVKAPGSSSFSTYWPHASHAKGECIDIYPMRKKGYTTLETGVGKKSYSSDLTVKFAKLLKKWGAETKAHRKSAQFFFNDPKVQRAVGARRLGNHDNHIHVCFRNTKANNRRCRNLKVDTNMCPTLKTPGEM